MAMQYKVQHHRIAVGFHRFRHLQLLLKRFFRTGQRRIQGFVTRLEADLDMIQPRLAERIQFLLRQADARGDQVGVEAEIARRFDQLRQIFTDQRLAAGESELHAAHRPRLTKHLNPLFGGQLLLLLGEIQRVGAVGTLQRTAIGQLGQQPERRIHVRFMRGHGTVSTSVHRLIAGTLKHLHPRRPLPENGYPALR